MSKKPDSVRRYEQLLKEQNIRPKKYNYGPKQVVVMPSPVQKKDLTDYAYGMDIDEKVVKMACTLAEKMAIAMVRETLSHINTNQMTEHMLDSITEKIVAAMPEQKTVIQQVVSAESAELKNEMRDLVFEGADIAIDRSKGLKLHGKVGETTESEDSTDDALDMLDNLQL